MKNYPYEKFEEVEEVIKQNAPSIIYKYRADWNIDHHREFITKQEMWFAAPRDLNDPYDIRTPLKFDVSEIEHPEFFRKLQEYHKFNNPSVAFTERDLRVICENKLDLIRRDPESYFENNYKDIRDSTIYDYVGLFSCTSDGLNESMWAHYANNHKGFAVGFNTVELSRELFCGLGPVIYNDEVPIYSFVNPREEDDFSLYYLKSKKWEYEKEFRYFTLGIEQNVDRLKIYPKKCVIEFLLGTKFPDNQLQDFIKQVREIFSKDIPIFRVQPVVSGFGLEKIKIR